jgi:hypothetical protein
MCGGKYLLSYVLTLRLKSLWYIPAKDEAGVYMYSPMVLFLLSWSCSSASEVMLALCDCFLRIMWPSCDRPAGWAWWDFEWIHTGTGIPSDGNDILCGTIFSTASCDVLGSVSLCLSLILVRHTCATDVPRVRNWRYKTFICYWVARRGISYNVSAVVSVWCRCLSDPNKISVCFSCDVVTSSTQITLSGSTPNVVCPLGQSKIYSFLVRLVSCQGWIRMRYVPSASEFCDCSKKISWRDSKLSSRQNKKKRQ